MQFLHAFISDIDFRSRDPRFPAPNAGRCADQCCVKFMPVKERTFSLPDFTFDQDRQVYRYPQGKFLKQGARSQRDRYRIYDIYRARPQYCAVCPVRSRFLSKPDAKYR